MFYKKEQTQKNKFKIWALKTSILDPPKSAFLVFEENPPPKKKKMFSSCFGFDSALKTNENEKYANQCLCIYT